MMQSIDELADRIRNGDDPAAVLQFAVNQALAASWATLPTVEDVATLISESVSEQTRLAPWEARPAARAVLDLLT